MREIIVFAMAFAIAPMILRALKPRNWEIRQVAQERHLRVKKIRARLIAA